MIRDINMTGRRPIFKYNGTKIKDPILCQYFDYDFFQKVGLPKPKARFGYEMSSEALVGDISNSSAQRSI